MSKILKDTDTVNLIKAGCNKVYSDNMNEIITAKDTLHKLQQDVADLYSLPLDIEKYFAMQRTGKLYQVKIPKYSYNTSPACIKTLDNAGLTCIPSTNTATNTNDYLTIPLFKWYNCNYIRNAYGEPIITYKEGDTGYATSGAVDVGCFGMSFYYSYLDGSNYNELDSNYYYLTISDKPNAEWYLQPWEGCVRHDGTVAPYWCYSKYFSGNVNQDLRSQPNLFPVCWMSHDRMLTAGTFTDPNKNGTVYGYQHKGQGYWGAGVDRHLFGYIFTMIKYATKSNQTVMAGCTNYNFQYAAADTTLTNTNYFPVTAAQAANFEIGSCVCVGQAYVSGTSAGIDRNTASMYSKVPMAKIVSKSQISGQSYWGLYLVDENNNAVTISDTADIESNGIVLHTYISTKPWISGTTDSIAGMNDGSMGNNGSANGGNINGGHFPFRVQGLEYSIGAWTVCGDTVMNVTTDTNINFYTAQKGVNHTNNTANILANYKLSGSMTTDSKSDFWVGDINISSVSESGNSSVVTFYPCSKGTGSSVGCGDYCYRNTTSGSNQWREVLLGGCLDYGAYAGFCCFHCGYGLSGSAWRVASAD